MKKFRFFYELRTAYSFADFCNDFKNEIGETLFNVCNPKLHKDKLFTIHIPEGNQRRIADTLNYGSCNVRNIAWKKAIIETV